MNRPARGQTMRFSASPRAGQTVFSRRIRLDRASRHRRRLPSCPARPGIPSLSGARWSRYGRKSHGRPWPCEREEPKAALGGMKRSKRFSMRTASSGRTHRARRLRVFNSFAEKKLARQKPIRRSAFPSSLEAIFEDGRSLFGLPSSNRAVFEDGIPPTGREVGRPDGRMAGRSEGREGRKAGWPVGRRPIERPARDSGGQRRTAANSGGQRRTAAEIQSKIRRRARKRKPAASSRWAGWMPGAPARSAMVRATLRIRV